MDWRFDNTEDFFYLDIGEFLSTRAISIGDITEATYMVKTNKLDLDTNSLVTLTIGVGLTKAPASGLDPDRLRVQFSSTDFNIGKLEVTKNTKERYYTGAGIKIAGYLTFLEMDIDDDRLEIVPDFIHD